MKLADSDTAAKRRLAALCLVIVLGACSPGLKQTRQTPERDAVVEAKIKAELIRANDIDAAAIQISTTGERVLLDGFVASVEESARAHAVAQKNSGTFSVVNRLEIR